MTWTSRGPVLGDAHRPARGESTWGPRRVRGPAARLAGRVALVVVAVLSVVAAPTVPAGAALSPAPSFTRWFGGSGTAGVYPWGIAANPVSGDIVVSDYWNFLVRRYDTSGHELAAFYEPRAQSKGQPYSIAVDPRNGDIYVSEMADGRPSGYIFHFTSTGSYLGVINTGAGYSAWITIDGRGRLYVADSAYWNGAANPPQIRVYDLDNGGAPIESWGTFGYGPGQLALVHGLGVAPSTGDVYAVDSVNETVHVFGPSGRWLRDIGSAGTGLGQFSGDLRGLAIDAAHGWFYVADAGNSNITRFTLAGTPLNRFGGVGTGRGQFMDGPRQITVDSSGRVWAADYAGFRFVAFGATGTLLASYPAPVQSPPVGTFNGAHDVAVAPNGSVWVADMDNSRLEKFAPNGTPLRAWGNRGSAPPYGLEYPRGVAVDPATGDVWLADTRHQVIRIYDESGNYLRTVGNGVASPAPGSFDWPMDIAFFGGRAFVADYVAERLRVLDTTTGAEITHLSPPPGYVGGTINGVAVDPATGTIYALDFFLDRIYQYSSSYQLVRTFGGPGSGPGQFRQPWGAVVVGGRLYVTDTSLDRVQVFSLTGSYLGGFGGTGGAAGQLRSPTGIAADGAGNLYITDTGNDRIEEFSTTATTPPPDAALPTVAITAPTAGQTLPVGAVQISGPAGDDARLGRVEVAVRDLSTGRWWHAGASQWSATQGWSLAIAAYGGPASLRFRLPFVGAAAGHTYQALARATDTSGNTTTTAAVQFTISG